MIFQRAAVVFDIVNPSRLRRFTVVAVFLLLGAVLQAQTEKPVPDADKLFDSGRAFQKWGEEAELPAHAIDYLQKAIEQYRQATQVRPDFHRALAMWGRCLYQMSRRTTDLTQRQTLILAARERYIAAVRCREPEWPAYHEWGQMLTSEVGILAANPGQGVPILQEAASALRAGLELARFSGERALIERDLGMCLLLLAEKSPVAAERRELYKQAIEKFDSATRAETVARTARVYGMWGVALLQLAKLENDRMMMRKAVERLQTSLELDAVNPETRYNLACAYALLDQPEAGMRHLRLCLDNDADRRFHEAARTDPDLNTLRRTPEFNELFGEKPPVLPHTLTQPKISGR